MKKVLYLNEAFEIFSFLLFNNVVGVGKINIYFTVYSLEAICEVVLRPERIKSTNNVHCRFSTHFRFRPFIFVREIF